MKVGSDREAATSPGAANARCRRDRYASNRDCARGDPSKLLLPAGSRVPKRSLSVQEQSGPGMQGSSLVRVQVAIVLAI